MRTALSRVVLAMVVSVVVAGCTGTSVTRSGAAAAPVRLVLANTDGKNLDGAPAVRYFVDRLQSLSGGTVTVEVVSGWKGANDEVATLRDVAAGQADLGWAGTRSLDQLGITDLTPLHAPFLVSSYNAQSAVISDPAVQERVESLSAAGLEGLAVLADELRMPVGISRPLRAPADYTGARIRTAASGIQSEALHVLGAEPAYTALTLTMDGAELMWWTYDVNEFYRFAPFPTVNTPLWPRSVVLVANPTSMAALPDEVRDWVRAASEDAVRWSVEHARDGEADHVTAACLSGTARIVTATRAQIAALKTQVQPVYERLRRDAVTAELFGRIQRLTSAAPPDEAPVVPAGCAFRPGDESLAPTVPTPLTAPGDPGALPEGVYRFELTPEFLRGAGLSEDDVHGNAGVLTYTLRDGRWSYRQLALNRDVENTTCEGFYSVEANRFTASTTTKQAAGECAPLVWTATWTVDGDTLTWKNVSVPAEPDSDDFSPVFAGDAGWRKIA